MAEKVDGRYKNQLNSNDEIKIDINGNNALKVISGTIYHRFKENTHWIADLQQSANQAGLYVGDIHYVNGFQDNFRYNRVTVNFDENDLIIVNYMINERNIRQQIYEKRSDYFRTLDLSIYREEGIKPVLEINPKAHYEYNNTLPDGNISLKDVFSNAGIDIHVNDPTEVVPLKRRELLENVKQQNWTDRELHDAMESYWDKFKNHPQWAMWVFLARFHADGIRIKGKMFDNIGPNHRQGVAVFYSSIEKSIPGREIGYEKQWTDRQKFWTTIHEIGHGLNLYHSWEREEVNSWLPLMNEPDFPSFMNYPSQYRGPGSYFKEFLYEFSKSELMFLRHAPEYFVSMGAANWFDKEGFGHWEENDELQLEICLNKHLFEFMEPVLINLLLVNLCEKPVKIPANILKSSIYTTIIVNKKGADPVIYERLVHDHSDISFQEVPGNKSSDNFLIESVNLSVGLAGWYISEPGEYTINAAVYYEDKILIANPVAIMIRLPIHRYEERIAQDYFTMSTAKVLYFNGSKTNTKANDHLKELLVQLPTRNAAIHAGISLAMPDVKPYKVFNHDMKQVKIISADHEKASLNLKNALKHSEAERSLGVKQYTNYVSLMKEQFKML